MIATLSFDTNLHTMMGVRPGAAVTALAEAGVDAVGANCGRGPGEMAQIAAAMVAVRPEGLLLVAQSNAGLPHVVGDHFEYDATPEDMAAHAAELQRPRHRADRGLLRLDARTHRGDEPGPCPLTAASSARTAYARCPWAAKPGTMRDYHDTEWGVPVRGERALFERMCLEGFQAGLSWSTILNKRERFREVFHGFDVDRVAAMTEDDVERLHG